MSAGGRRRPRLRTRTAAVAVAAGLVALAASAGAQAAAIEGRIVHAERPEAVADLEVELLGLVRGGQPFRRLTRSDANGAFRFADLPAPASYLVAARYAGISFPGGSASFPDADAPDPPPIVFHVYEPSADASVLQARLLRWVVEREAGEYQVAHSLQVSNPSQHVVVSDAAPLLRLALAPGHRDVRGPFGPLPEGTTLVGDALELRGPFLPGQGEVRVHYGLGEQPALATQLPTATAVETLELYVEDFGVTIDPGGLHPARPVRSGDSIYQAFLGFQIDAGEAFDLSVTPLPARGGTPPLISALLVGAVAALALYFVGQPLAGLRRAEPAAEPGEPADADPEREALRLALADLEFDYETGKLSRADRDQLRAELRRDAARVLSRTRPGDTSPAPAPTAVELAPTCACGRKAAPGDRFCAECGSPL